GFRIQPEANTMKYYIIAGEASGDLHGSNLIKEIKKLDTQSVIRAWGGDLMQSAGAQIIKHYRELAFMGFTEVIKNLPTILNNLKFCKKDIEEFQPDVVILIDYPGFNLRIAKWVKEKGFKVVYYISPQVWAWKESRVKSIKKYVDKMLVILPFEKEFYNKWGYKVDYVGHPLVHVIEESKRDTKPLITDKTDHDASKPIIALLPGSRKQEIQKKLPVMLEASSSFSHQFRIVVAMAPSNEDEFYRSIIKDQNVETTRDTYALLKNAKAALVTSGTATLETALFGVPEVVCYKGSSISYQIAKRLIKIKYISLVNLIMDKQVVKELIQDDLTRENLEMELNNILFNVERISHIKNDYEALKILLSKGGNASQSAAQEIVGLLKTNV
ncbi:MAG: lipid-A-disaccharide synthase, partial [Flavisolibacter sp.]